MTVTTTYTTSDGKQFENKAEADKHQDTLDDIAVFLKDNSVNERSHKRLTALLLKWEARAMPAGGE